MPKNLNDRKVNKAQSVLEHRGQRESRESDKGNSNPDRQPRQEDKPDVFNERQQQPRMERMRNAREFRRENQDKNMADGNKRGSGCLPRVLMMALPLVAFGVFLFLAG